MAETSITQPNDLDRRARDVLHANIDTLWDALALLDAALAHEDLREPTGAARVIRIATDKLHELDEVLSPVV